MSYENEYGTMVQTAREVAERHTCRKCGHRRLCLPAPHGSWECLNGCEKPKIVFWNNTDYERSLTFNTKRDFLSFANSYISHPSQWGNRYSQTIEGIDIRWSGRACRGDGGWVEA